MSKADHEHPRYWTISFAVTTLFVAAIAILGASKGWNFSDGRYRFGTVHDLSRFQDIPKNRVLSEEWYYWKIPRVQVTFLSRFLPWICYLTHQFLSWMLIYAAQKTNPKYSNHLRWFNYWSLALHFVFGVIHLIQTHTTYDGLAQDTTNASNQDSLVLMLAFIMIMEFRNRGFMYGLPNLNKKSTFLIPPTAIYLFRKYHAYAFSYSLIFTFWYHPCEATFAHLTGFAHISFLLIQGALMYTRFHLNLYWRFLLELFVLFHATITTIQQDVSDINQNRDYFSYFLGFFFLCVATQMWSLTNFRESSLFVRSIPSVIYLLCVIGICFLTRRWIYIVKPLRISLSLWIFGGLAVCCVWICDKILMNSRVQKCRNRGSKVNEMSKMKEYVYVVGMLTLCYGINFVLSIYVEKNDTGDGWYRFLRLVSFGVVLPGTSIVSFFLLDVMVGSHKFLVWEE